MTGLFTIHANLLWDVAGVDGLQVMKALAGQQIDRIAPFQSLETEIDHVPCSILRLCEGNFRLRWSGHPDHAKSILNSVAAQQRVWVKQFPWLSSLQLSDATTVSQLVNVAIAKPPFSLTSLALNCAAPARINSISVLVWRHTIDHIETLELHTAAHHMQHLQLH